MIGGIIGVAALVALPWMIVVTLGILFSLDGWNLAAVIAVYGYITVRVWRWLTRRDEVAPLEVHAPALVRGTPPAAAAKPAVQDSPRTSLDDDEEDEEASW